MKSDDKDAIIGSWLNSGWRIRLDIRREGDEYIGRIAEGLDESRLDSANRDPGLRSRKILGADIVHGLRARGGMWKGGSIYDQESGRTFSLKVSLAGADKLLIRSYGGLPFNGTSQVWTRLDPTLFPDAAAMAAEAGLDKAPPVWPLEKARAWYASRPWPVGCNFIPSTAINELEMWQADTFDPETIGRELDLAAALGFNSLRVYLHFLPWKEDKKAFLERITTFLDLAAARKLSTLFVLFDDCWNDNPRPGRQPRPQPGIHNSGWLRCPGSSYIDDELAWPALEDYASGIISSLAHDERVLGWDLYNEIGNFVGFRPNTTRLLARVFLWARRAQPAQPITSGIWQRSCWFAGVNRFLLERSDIVSFHQYGPLETMKRWIDDFTTSGRPLLCTEYMARSQNSRFESHLPLLKANKIGALSWGLVAGKTNTIYPWSSRRGSPEPKLWFHDIFRPDGRPWNEAEVAAIRGIIAGTPT